MYNLWLQKLEVGLAKTHNKIGSSDSPKVDVIQTAEIDKLVKEAEKSQAGAKIDLVKNRNDLLLKKKEELEKAKEKFQNALQYNKNNKKL